MMRMVTITGADDSTPVSEMRKITNEFPFVEWGILIGSHVGERFPSWDWCEKLVAERGRSGERMNLSLHVCGKWLRQLCVGVSPFESAIGWMYAAFDRIQLNFHGNYQGDVGERILSGICKTSPEWDPEVIFQADGVNGPLINATSRRYRCSRLFDQSHGGGIVPDEWPESDSEFPCGWAGGLGPENLKDELKKIQNNVCPIWDYWIDMETKVRSGSCLDLEKVRRCLEICKESMPDH